MSLCYFRSRNHLYQFREKIPIGILISNLNYFERWESWKGTRDLKKKLSWREIHYSIAEYLRGPSSSRSTDCWVCPRTIWSDFIYRSRMPDRASGWSLQIISADGAASAIVQEGQHPAHPPLGHGPPWLTFNQNCETSTRNSSHFSPFFLHRCSFLVSSSDGIRRIKFENVFYFIYSCMQSCAISRIDLLKSLSLNRP